MRLVKLISMIDCKLQDILAMQPGAQMFDGLVGGAVCRHIWFCAIYPCFGNSPLVARRCAGLA